MPTFDEKSAGGHILIYEQKDVVWMKDLIREFTSAEQTVVDSFVCTFATAKGCTFPASHPRFLGARMTPAVSVNHYLRFWRYLREQS